jgi:hypothetical protein
VQVAAKSDPRGLSFQQRRAWPLTRIARAIRPLPAKERGEVKKEARPYNKPSYSAKAEYPVITDAAENLRRSGILDHPLSRMMTVFIVQ